MKRKRPAHRMLRSYAGLLLLIWEAIMTFKELPKFDDNMDKLLLENGFARYDDWKYAD